MSDELTTQEHDSSHAFMSYHGNVYRIYGANAPDTLRKVLDNLPEPVGFIRGDGEESNIIAPRIGLKNMVEVLGACYSELVYLGGQTEDIIAAELYNSVKALEAYVEADRNFEKCRDEFVKYIHP